MGYDRYEWGEYVSVAERRRLADKKVAELKKRGRSIAPVSIEGKAIATTFWGKSWCSNLERYSDYATRLPRGRSYLRNGCVVDLQIAKGKVTAMVSGSSLYNVKATIRPVVSVRWRAICLDCAGAIDSVVELLQGRLAKGVMDRVCRDGDGLFPAPDEIRFSCSCPDSATMCKHVAAALYGIGARLDETPQLLFVLRGVDEHDLLARAGEDLAKPKSALTATKVLDDSDVVALFGLEMAETASSSVPVAAASKPSRQAKMTKERKAAARTDVPAAKNGDAPRPARSKAGSTLVRKKRARRQTKLSP